MAKGNISVDSENLFPIIKKWLYSDKDIFLRELVSNGCDAVTKLKKLASIGDAKIGGDEKFKVTVSVMPEAKKLVISDNGIGMTAEEIDKYINQIAFSGASDFLAKYKEEDDTGAQIIGHFGLGFYSAFMVADSVEIDSLSYQDGAKAAKWMCDGSMEFDMTEGTRTERGTTITLNIAEDSEEFLDEYKVRQILNKYCAFLPIEVYLETPEKKVEEKEGEEKEEPKPINDTNPLWMKKPSECTDEEYKDFYRKVFMDFNEPLFWIHLNVDYPFNLKGILYFPKINHEFAGQEGQIKLFNNQVFVADNVKEVIPEFLMLLKGVIDCPDLPLNVSRSFLQNDGYVKKISAHITKKVADKLTSLYNSEKENYEKYWEDIDIFIKYGCLRDEKFYDKVKNIIIYKNLDDKFVTLDEYLGDKEDKTVYYVSDPKTQSQYINMFKNQGLDAVVLPSMMDTHFISFVEMKNEGVKFKRIDSAIDDISENAEKDDA
ncbi:MAG: molecular chaperone HtpG, partial [Clostridia bacterium]|nr:molecular chaperone HtpG [Clostridia bacterium]